MLRFLLAITAVVLLSTSGIFTKDLISSQGNFTLKVNGTTGNIALNFKDEESLNFNFVSLIEKASNGTAIDVADPKTHSFSNFSGVNYTVTDFVNGTYQNINCLTAQLKGALLGSSSLNANIYYFTQGGIIPIEKDLNETVQIGSVVLSFGINGWKFCNNNGTASDEAICNSNGTAIQNSVLDFTFDVSGKKVPVASTIPATGGNYTYGQSYAYFTANYFADDVSNKMTVGYPSLTSSNTANLYTVRFAKATKSLKWNSVFIIRKQDVVPTPTPTPTPTPDPTPSPSPLSIGNYSLAFVGRSGKVNMNYLNETRLTFEFSKLVEVFANGTEVEAKAENHTFNNFANLNLSISNFTSTQFQNLSALTSTVSVSNFFRKASISASFYIFNQSGLIKTGVQVVNNTNVDVFEYVPRGAVKLSLGVQNWTFCNNLGDANDELACNFGSLTKNITTELDMEVIITSKSQGNASCGKKNNTNSCNFTDGASATFSPFYTADNTNYRAMPDGYPRVVSTGNKNTMRFRFGNFKSGIVWDPIFITQVEINPSPAPTPSPKTDDDEFIRDIEVAINYGDISFQSFGLQNKTVANFSMNLYRIEEIDATGQRVGNSTKGHFDSNLREYQYNISSVETKYPGSDLNVTVIQMASLNNIGSSAKLLSKIYIFGQDGEITLENTKYKVKDGDLKFEFQISNWTFCTVNTTNNVTTGNCQGNNNTFEKADYLQMQINIKELTNNAVKSGNNFKFGENTLILPTTYLLDGKPATMVTDYPKYTVGAYFDNSKNSTMDSIAFRFVPFSNSVSYGPIVNFPSIEGKSGSSALIIIIIIIAVALLGVAIFVYCRSKSSRKHSDAIEKGNRFVDV